MAQHTECNRSGTPYGPLLTIDLYLLQKDSGRGRSKEFWRSLSSVSSTRMQAVVVLGSCFGDLAASRACRPVLICREDFAGSHARAADASRSDLHGSANGSCIPPHGPIIQRLLGIVRFGGSYRVPLGVTGSPSWSSSVARSCGWLALLNESVLPACGRRQAGTDDTSKVWLCPQLQEWVSVL